VHLTFVGIAIFLAGLIIFISYRTRASMALLLACGPLGGSAAVLLNFGSSIPPVEFALGVAITHLALIKSNHPLIGPSIRSNWPLIGFAVTAAALAYIGPRIFYDQMSLPSMRSAHLRSLYETFPLRPSSQNITTAIYILGTTLAAVFSCAFSMQEGSWRYFVKTAVIVGWINVALGIGSMFAKGTPLHIFYDLLRNASYAQLDQEFQGLVRVYGAFPEASGYSAYAFVWFCFCAECWIRNVLPRWTGPAALGMFIILFISTSSTAYVGLAAYLLFTVPRIALTGTLDRSRKLAVLLILALAAFIVGGVVVGAHPKLGTSFYNMLQRMTLDKAQSSSGLQRAFWAREGMLAFVKSYGLGVGPGSFRTSGIIAAILGSTGVIGAIFIIVYLIIVFKPLHASTWEAVNDDEVSTGVAASWTALFALVPYGLSAPTPDPGVNFALLAGMALGLRRASLARSKRIRTAGLSIAQGAPRGAIILHANRADRNPLGL
jgi:hypothetical protein